MLPFNPYKQQDRVITVKEQQAIKKQKENAKRVKKAAYVPILDKEGNVISQASGRGGNLSAKGIIGRNVAVSDAYRKMAYEYRKRTGKQLSQSKQFQEKVRESARKSSYLSSRDARDFNTIIEIADTPLLDTLSKSQSLQIREARNIVMNALPIAEHKKLYSNWLKFDKQSRNAQFSASVKAPYATEKQKKNRELRKYEGVGDGNVYGRPTKPADKEHPNLWIESHSPETAKKAGRALVNWSSKKVDYAVYHPVEAAVILGLTVASGYAAGAVIEGGIAATGAGAARVAAGASKPIVKKAAGAVGKHVGTVGHGALGVGISAEGYKVIREGDINKTLDFFAGLGVGGIGYSKGAKKALSVIGDPISVIPGIRSIKVQEITTGSTTGTKNIKGGVMLEVMDKPVVSYQKGTGLKRGIIPIPKEKLTGKQVQAFNKLDTKVFAETLKQFGDVEHTYFKSGHKVASAISLQKTPVTKPKKLDILSEHIPQKFKPIVRETIIKYGGFLKLRDIQVYGSVTQKLQMEGFLTRNPKDIEVSVSSTGRFLKMFKSRAEKAGYVEGKDYRIKGSEEAPKIEFNFNGKWEKGVEVFSHKGKIPSSETRSGFTPEEGIAYGFKTQKSIKVDSVKMMRLSEQGGRKLEGASTLIDGKIVPKHEGRVKDVRDLIEIGTAYEVTRNLGIARDIISYAEIGVKKHPEIKESGIVKHIAEKKKLPTIKEIYEYTGKEAKEIKADVKELELIYKSSKPSVSKTVSRVRTIPISRASSKPSSGISSRSSIVSRSSRLSRPSSSSSLKSSKPSSRTSSKPSSRSSKPSSSASSKPASRSSSKPSSRSSKPSSRASSSKSSSSSGKYTRAKLPVIPPVPKRKDKKDKMLEKELLEFERAYRIRKNKMGSLSSVLGGGTKKKPTTKRKPVTRRKTTTRKRKVSA